MDMVILMKLLKPRTPAHQSARKESKNMDTSQGTIIIILLSLIAYGVWRILWELMDWEYCSCDVSEGDKVKDKT